MKKENSRLFDIVVFNASIADDILRYLKLKKKLKNFKKHLFNSNLVIRIKCNDSKRNIDNILKKHFRNNYKIL